MRDIFPAYYSPESATFKKLWSDATIVLDANVLLNLYRYPVQARDDLFSVLRKVSDRLFVPHQAALEFQRGRLKVIASQLKRFDEVHKALTETRSHLDGEFSRLQLKKRHASINPDKLLGKLHDLFEAFNKDLQQLEKKHPAVTGKDEIRTELDEILKGKVGESLTQDELDALYKDGKIRYEQSRPPGYLDAGKSKDDTPIYTSSGLRIERQYGDLILWRQTIKEAKNKELKQVILVTDEEKPDWWLALDSKGKKTIGPRPELIEELRSEADVDAFYMYSSERFLSYAREYLGVHVKEESITQVRESKPIRRSIPNKQNSTAEIAVRAWLEGIHPASHFTRLRISGRGFDLGVQFENRLIYGYDIRATRTAPPERLRRVTEQLMSKSLLVDRHYIIWVYLQDGVFEESGRRALESLHLPENVVIVFGHIDFISDGIIFEPDGQFP